MAADELAPGMLFADRYRVQGIVARGGMGAVYRAFDDRMGELVALKVLPPDGPEGEDSIARFHREVRLARRVTHKNVARVFDFGESDGLSYLTMELIEGESLRQMMIARKRFPLREAIDAAIAIADGLAAAHEAGVVHRDLKPANVVVERATGRLVVTDFGIARSLVDDDGLRTVGAIGTPAYMAPEQMLGELVDGRSDVYALGVVLFEMITGARPFGGAHAAADVRARLVAAPPDPRVHVGMPEPVARLVMRFLARSREDRPRSATEAASQLRALLEIDLERTSHPPPLGSRADRVVAILNFRATGADEDADLAEGIAEELGDVLARTRGLRIISHAAMARFSDGHGRGAARAAGADAVVDGSVERDGSRVRVAARLLEVGADEADGGEPIWTETFEGALDDVFALQTSMAERIAEGLRVEIGTAVAPGEASREAIELYLRGRRALRRMRIVETDGALALLEACVAAAPSFKPGIAAFAVASVRAWFLAVIAPTRDFQTLARTSVQRALAEASEMPETHLAAGLLAAQEARFRDVAIELGKAIEIAPTCAPAHEYLASLEIQAGRTERGLRRSRYVLELDPLVFTPLSDMARHHALFGRMAEYEALCAEMDSRGGSDFAGKWQMRMRVAAWCGKNDEMTEAAERLSRQFTSTAQLADLYSHSIAGKLDPKSVEVTMGAVLARANPRWRAFGHQMLAEMYGLVGQPDGVVAMLELAVAGPFIDLEWLDRCPALDIARDRPEMVALRRRVMEAAEHIWSS